MKRLEVDLREFINLRRNPLISTKDWIESRLKEAGFNLDKEILSTFEVERMKYIYKQD